MLDVMGLDPFDLRWSGGSSSSDEERLRSAVDSLVGTLLEQRQTARATKDFTTADAIRDRIKAAGIEVEDTPSGPSWSLSQQI
jgi:cysteinyl-tRNA synthetase